MKNRMFSGWKDVLLFTFSQEFNKKYGIVTLILAIVLFAGGFAFNVLNAKNQLDNDTTSPVEKVYLIDNSGIDNINWNDSKQLDREKFPKVTFEVTDLEVSELGLKLMNNEPESVIASVSKEKKTYKIQVYLPYESEITKDEGENLAKGIKTVLYEGMIDKSEIDSDMVTYVVSGIKTEYSIAGEETKDEDSMMFKSMAPLILMMAIYFMVIIYGQSMGQIVCVEKSSKLMESLLVMTRPYGLIFGKILATAGIAIFQMAVCVATLLLGFVLGDNVARNSVYTNYENPVLTMINEIATEEMGSAFSTVAVVMTILAVCLAFLFYCMLSGAIASFASKTEELGSVMMFYNIFLVIGFLAAYALPTVSGQEWIKVVVRIVPVSSAFMLPGEILLGTIKPNMAIIYVLVQLVWVILTAIFAGKIYKDQVFYNGKSLADRLPWMKKKSDDSNEQWQMIYDEEGRPLRESQRIGYFFLAISPFAVFMVVQLFTSMLLMNTIIRWDFRGIDIHTWEVKELADYYHRIEPMLNPLALLVMHSLITTIAGLWMYFIRRGIDRSNIIHIKNSFQKKWAVVTGVCLICGLGLLVLANGVVVIENGVVPSVVENYVESANSTGMGKSPFAIIAAVCLAPIGEELMCRGVCLHFGKKVLGRFWYANILQSLLFGIMHMNWVQGVYAFIIGLALGILVERYDSLLPGMIIHFIINFSSSTWFPKVISEMDISLTAGIMMVAISGAIVIGTLRFSE